MRYLDDGHGASDSGLRTAGTAASNWSAIELEVSDVRACGKDERLPEASRWKGVQFWYDYVRMITSQ